MWLTFLEVSGQGLINSLFLSQNEAENEEEQEELLSKPGGGE